MTLEREVTARPKALPPLTVPVGILCAHPSNAAPYFQVLVVSKGTVVHLILMSRVHPPKPQGQEHDTLSSYSHQQPHRNQRILDKSLVRYQLLADPLGLSQK